MTNGPDASRRPWRRGPIMLLLAAGVIGAAVAFAVFSSRLPPLPRLELDPPGTEVHNRNNVVQVSNGLGNFSIGNHSGPGPFMDTDGKTPVPIPDVISSRLSWRVALLPYIEQGYLYSQFNKSEAWDSATNAPLSQQRVTHYADFADPPHTSDTPYRVFYDNGALWDSDPKQRLPLDKIPDGASNTILVVESNVKVRWAQFNEHPYTPGGPLPPLGRGNRDTFLVGMADGSVRTVKKTVSPATLNAAITRAGNDVLGTDW